MIMVLNMSDKIVTRNYISVGVSANRGLMLEYSLSSLTHILVPNWYKLLLSIFVKTDR